MKTLSTSHYVGLILVIASLGFLLPGIMQPILQVSAELQLGKMQLSLFKETRSILGTISHLFKTGYYIVGFLIGLFSIFVPIGKMILLCVGVMHRDAQKQKKYLWIAQLISKWSMVDVMVVAVIVSFLALDANTHLKAVLMPGFYYFFTYCVLSILSTYFLEQPAPKATSLDANP